MADQKLEARIDELEAFLTNVARGVLTQEARIDELEPVVKGLAKKYIVVESTALNNMLMIIGIFTTLKVDLNIDVDKLLKEIQTPEKVKSIAADNEKMYGVLERVLNSDELKNRLEVYENLAQSLERSKNAHNGAN